ncbi:endopeptidase La [Clostridium sp. YIM B02505]|uniref:Lon protease n=1 Tax=Clostridium yunnanense TaxID=2800325 RepID=A0ABS1EP71_9CLOT|nr:endopeptidase La [Clostridium yunnanense]MBK1811151.1 endopeptidase La [Clostridium yunnanense]
MNNLDIKKELPLIIIPNTVLLPGKSITVKTSKEVGDSFYNRVMAEDNYGIVLAIKGGKQLDAYEDMDFHTVGTLINLKERKALQDGYHFVIDVLERVVADEFIREGEDFRVTFNYVPDVIDLDENNQKEIMTHIKTLVSEISGHFKGSEAYVEYIKKLDDITAAIAYLFPFMNINFEARQAFLEIRSLREKSLRFLDILIEQREAIKFQVEISEKYNSKINKNYREQMLRQQLKAIQEELNETDDSKTKKKKDYRELIETAEMPEDVKEVALNEIDKLERQSQNSTEGNVIRNYLDLLTSLPWGKSEVRDIDIAAARDLLNSKHYGLDKVKDRIIQHLTIMKLKQNKQGSILLLVGPPGTGKTSLGKSIAEALNRKYVRASLGGVRDESEVRGHRRTYVGALPGRIIQGMKKAGEKNPVFILDEIDKLSVSANGDPSSALLEVLDPEQNNSFSDHYLEVPYDLSEVFFIATANSLRDIPGPLRDRMEIIDISSYTSHEKFYIAKEHLVNAVLEDHGLSGDQLVIEDDALKVIIEKYTREAGVRGLKRQISKVARVSAEKIVNGAIDLPYIIKADMVTEILGHNAIQYDRANEKNAPGVVTGLAWTPVGGDILFIEGVYMPGNGQLILTGQLGDVMKESAKISQSLIRSRLALSLKNFEFNKNDLHIHVPAGATPKDGPSAGVALFTTIASLITGREVDPKLAMTGEISLRGAVLPVGGIKEKVLAAHRAGIKRVILPKGNEKDIDDIPVEVRNELKFILVDTIEDVLRETIDMNLPNPNALNIAEEIEQLITI